jgi:hypothetical protein
MDGSPQAARLTMVRSLFPGMVVCPTYNGGSLPSSLKRCCWAWRLGLVSEKLVVVGSVPAQLFATPTRDGGRVVPSLRLSPERFYDDR